MKTARTEASVPNPAKVGMTALLNSFLLKENNYMRYELINNSNKGVITDATPVLRDVSDTIEIGLTLPVNGAYVALVRGEDNVERKVAVKDGKIKVPPELLKKEQRVSITVCLTDGEKILHSWECHPFQVGVFLQMRQTQVQLTAALTDEEYYKRLAEIERKHAEVIKELKDTRAALDAEQQSNAELKKAYETATDALAAADNQFKLQQVQIAELLAFAETCTKKIPYINDIKISNKEDKGND